MGKFGPPLTALASVLVLLWVSPALANPVGSALEVTQGTQITTTEGTTRLTFGMLVHAGDTIKTNSTGQAQLLFDDDTKIAVGAKSQLVLDDIVLRPNGSAKRFAINALGGTFRFISGKSPKNTYEINTPTATMGIRGTVFDFSVSHSDGTSVVLFEGEVELCLQNGNCERASGACTLSRARGTQLQVGITGGDSKNSVLRERFPYVVSQSRLLDPFRTATHTCGNIQKPTRKKPEIVPPPPPPPPIPDPPEPDPPEPDPEESFPEQDEDNTDASGTEDQNNDGEN